MSDDLTVIAGDTVAGTLHRLVGGTLRFDYDEAYAASETATPLSLSMPLTTISHPDRMITPWLWGLLPDDPSVIARWARHFDLSRAAPFTLLGTAIGADCAGAVRFAHPERAAEALSREGHVTWLTDDDMAELIVGLSRDPANWLGSAFTGQFSLAGAQAKTALHCQDGRWGIPSGATPTTHILKPAIVGLTGHDINEHLCLDAALRAGLATVPSRVLVFGGVSAIVVTRYDRAVHGGIVRRIHQEDLCQALSVPPTRKYQNDGGPGPREIAGLLRRAMPMAEANQAVHQFADALIWNWLVGGTDGHAKNYSLLLSRNAVRFAPLYDIASALPYGDHEKKLRLAMKIGGDYHLNPYRNRWPDAAADLRLSPEELVARARELAAAAPDAFNDAAKVPDIGLLESDLPSRLADLVAERSLRCARMLGS